MSVATILTFFVGLALAYGVYSAAQMRTTTGALRYPRAAALLPPGRGSFFAVFAVGWVIIALVDVATGGSLSHADRFWVGTALGLGVGALLATIAIRFGGRSL